MGGGWRWRCGEAVRGYLKTLLLVVLSEDIMFQFYSVAL